MTPLAYRIAKQTWTPIKQRERFDDAAQLLKNHKLEDVHCFEISQAFDVIDELGYKWYSACIKDNRWVNFNAIDKRLAFLPAPKTWIEYIGSPNEPTVRIGLLLEEFESLALCTISSASPERGLRSLAEQMVLALHTRDDFAVKKNPDLEPLVPEGWQTTTLFRIYAALAAINSPKVIGRIIHPPHKTLVRQFAIGKFPLHGWTEIKLLVNKPADVDDGLPHEARLTGRRALHFCRAHIRVRLGVLEYVRSHWRGDPAIGIKQTRYTVLANKQGAKDD